MELNILKMDTREANHSHLTKEAARYQEKAARSLSSPNEGSTLTAETCAWATSQAEAGQAKGTSTGPGVLRRGVQVSLQLGVQCLVSKLKGFEQGNGRSLSDLLEWWPRLLLVSWPKETKREPRPYRCPDPAQCQRRFWGHGGTEGNGLRAAVLIRQDGCVTPW